MDQRSAAPYLPEQWSLASLRRAVADCRGCDLYERATQAVFGEGLRRARLVLVGEQPGDREDRVGRPFVGPAGRLLDECLVAAGIDRADAYVTNAVKHFRWEARGKRRMHKKPSAGQLRACRPWLEAEIDVVQPVALVLLGASAAQSVLGPQAKVTELRGQALASRWAPCTVVTVHPSSVLRVPDETDRRTARAALIRDFEIAARALAAGGRQAVQP